MPKIVWDAAGEKKYEVGVDRGVLYQEVAGGFVSGVAWNGLIEVDGESEGEDATPLYTGDVKTENLPGYDDYSGTITAYTYPDEFESCIGSTQAVPGIFAQQQRKTRFGLCYRSLIGNDSQGQEHGYKLHLIYNAEITGNSVSRNTINDSPEAVEFAWDFSTIPMIIDGYDPYSEIIIDSTKFSTEFMEDLEKILYGTDEESPRLPVLDELIELYSIEEPIPPDWEGYPYEQLYPSNDYYPMDTSAHILVYRGRLYFNPGDLDLDLELRNGKLMNTTDYRKVGLVEGRLIYDLPLYYEISFEIDSGTIQNNGGQIELEEAGYDSHGNPVTFIPANATITNTEFYNIPDTYSNLTYNAFMNSAKTEIRFSYSNQTGASVTITNSFHVTVRFYYEVEGVN